MKSNPSTREATLKGFSQLQRQARESLYDTGFEHGVAAMREQFTSESEIREAIGDALKNTPQDTFASVSINELIYGVLRYIGFGPPPGDEHSVMAASRPKTRVPLPAAKWRPLDEGAAR